MSRVSRLAVSLAAAGVSMFFGQAVWAQQSVWTAMANTGAIDESGRSIYVFHPSGSVAIDPSVSSGTLEVRYNVTGVELIGETAEPAPPDSDLES